MNVETHSFSLKQMCGEVAEWSADPSAQSAQQLKIAAMSFDEQKIFAATKEGLEQNTTDNQKAQRTVDVPLLQCTYMTVDVPVAKTPQKTARGLHDEVQRNQGGEEAAFSIAQDREQEADWRLRW